MFISLASSYAGNACGIKESINRYNIIGKTHFFDWLICSMRSVNEVLEGKEILFDTNYTYPNSLGTTSINFLNFNLLISHHDIVEPSDDKIKETIERYKRRYERFINTVKEENKIFFIRYCKHTYDIEEDQINLFIQKIKNINTNLIFKFKKTYNRSLIFYSFL